MLGENPYHCSDDAEHRSFSSILRCLSLQAHADVIIISNSELAHGVSLKKKSAQGHGQMGFSPYEPGGKPQFLRKL